MNIIWLSFGVQLAVLPWGALGLMQDKGYEVPALPDWEARSIQRKARDWRPLPRDT